MFGKSWDRFCVVANSHSNKAEQSDASVTFAEKPTLLRLLLERLSAAKMAMSAATNKVIQGVIFQRPSEPCGMCPKR